MSPPTDTAAVAHQLRQFLRAGSSGEVLVLADGSGGGVAARPLVWSALDECQTSHLELRCDSEPAWQASLVRALRHSGYPEAALRAPDHARLGLRRWLSQHPGVLVWIDGLCAGVPVEELLQGTDIRILITGAAATDLSRHFPASQPLHLTGHTDPPPRGLIDALWTGDDQAGHAADWSRAVCLQFRAHPVARLLILWACVDWCLDDAELLLTATGLADPGAALDWLQAQGLVQRGPAGRWTLDCEQHRQLVHALPEEVRAEAVDCWLEHSRSWSNASSPEAYVLHAAALATLSQSTPRVCPATTDALREQAALLCERVGAWTEATRWRQQLVHARQLAQASVFDRARAWQRLAAAQRGANQLLDARRSARAAEEALSAEHDRHLELLLEIKCDIAEIDLADGRAERACARLETVRTALREPSPERALLARWMFLYGACLLAGKGLESSEKLLTRSLTLREALLPADHPALLAHRALLARNLFAQQNWVAAESVLQADLRIRRDSPAVTATEAALTANLLAELYVVQGRYAAAEPLLDEVLAVRRQTLPPGDRLLGETTARLAALKSSRGDYAAADSLFREALRITETIYGADHPRVAEILGDLAKMLFTQSRFDQARRLLDRALAIQTQALRKTDPRIAETRNNLAAVYVARGLYADAARLYETTLQSLEQTYPGDHPTKATTLNNLGDVLRSLGRLHDAEQRLADALSMRERLLGPSHPIVAQSLSNLGYLRLLQGRLEEAHTQIERALQIRREALSAVHPHIANSLTTLGEIARRRGNIEAAVQAFEQAADINRQAFGERHQQTGASLARLGRAELKAGRKARAELRLLKARVILEDSVGVDHRLIAEAWLGLAELDRLHGRHQAAFPLLERSLAIQRQTAAGDPWEIAETLLAIGENLLSQQSPAGAAERLAEAERLLTSLPTSDSPLLLSVWKRSAEAALAQRQPGAAGEFLRRALALRNPQVTAADRQALLALQAEIALAEGRVELAESQWRELIESAEADLGAQDPQLAPWLDRLGAVLVLRRQFEAAESVTRRSLALTIQQHGRRHASVAARLVQLGSLLAQWGRDAESLSILAEAAEVYELLDGQDPAPLIDVLHRQALALQRLHRPREAELLVERADALAGRTSHVLEDLL